MIVFVQFVQSPRCTRGISLSAVIRPWKKARAVLPDKDRGELSGVGTWQHHFPHVLAFCRLARVGWVAVVHIEQVHESCDAEVVISMVGQLLPELPSRICVRITS